MSELPDQIRLRLKSGRSLGIVFPEKARRKNDRATGDFLKC
jgi:hypothetical protein